METVRFGIRAGNSTDIPDFPHRESKDIGHSELNFVHIDQHVNRRRSQRGNISRLQESLLKEPSARFEDPEDASY